MSFIFKYIPPFIGDFKFILGAFLKVPSIVTFSILKKIINYYIIKIKGNFKQKAGLEIL